MKTVYIDTETTGLNPESDEVVEIAIIDDAGAVLLDALVKPERITSWPDAQKIHGISPAMVAGAPTLVELLPAIRAATEGRRVVIYNASFDEPFIPGLAEWAAEICCAMLEFAEFAGEWSEYRGGYRWHKLVVAARHVEFEWPGEAHRATADAQACRAVWRYLDNPAERQRVELEREAAQALAMNEARERQREVKHAHYMDTFWRHWWLRRYGTDQHWVKSVRGKDYQDALALVFFGKPAALLELEDAGLPVYRNKAEIPAILRPANYFPKESWIRAELIPAAVYVGKQTGWHLYHENEMDRIKARHPLRFVQALPGLMTATQLQKQGVSRKQIAAMKPVAERQNPYTHRWHGLYLPPDTENM